MKDIIKLIKGYVDDLMSVLISLIGLGAVAGIIFQGGLFGLDVIGNLMSLVIVIICSLSLNSAILPVCDFSGPESTSSRLDLDVDYDSVTGK